MKRFEADRVGNTGKHKGQPEAKIHCKMPTDAATMQVNMPPAPALLPKRSDDMSWIPEFSLIPS